VAGFGGLLELHGLKGVLVLHGRVQHFRLSPKNLFNICGLP
jgi:hypothetical protein